MMHYIITIIFTINKLIITICIKALTLTKDQYKLELVQHNIKNFSIIVKY